MDINTLSQVQAAKPLTKFVVSVAGYIKRGRSRIPARMYVTAVSWHDGSGMRAKKFNYCEKPERAHQFAKLTAQAFVEDLRRFNVIDPQVTPVTANAKA